MIHKFSSCAGAKSRKKKSRRKRPVCNTVSTTCYILALVLSDLN